MDLQRQSFENYLFSTEKFKFRNKSFLFMLDENGEYEDQPVLEIWEAWQQAQKTITQNSDCSIKSHEIIINEVKNELINGYDIAKEDEHLLESLVYRGVCIGKAQKVAVPECHWVKNEDGMFDTKCDNTFVFYEPEDTPENNNFKNCCFCGGLIKAQE